jgi:hypothetical protein
VSANCCGIRVHVRGWADAYRKRVRGNTVENIAIGKGETKKKYTANKCNSNKVEIQRDGDWSIRNNNN